MVASSPYRLQIFLSRDVQRILQDLAHEERTSLQKLVTQWLEDKIQEYPQYRRAWLKADGQEAGKAAPWGAH